MGSEVNIKMSEINKLGKNIKKFRLLKGWNQQQLGEKMGVSRQTITNWETDYRDPDLEKAFKLAEIFDISLEELIGQDGAKKVSSEIVKYNNNKLKARFSNRKIDVLHRELDILTDEELDEIEFALEVIKARREKRKNN